MNQLSITKREGFKPLKAKKRVASYSRVSVEKEMMLNSLGNQVNYYQKLISNHQDWQYVGAYVDEGISGSKENRPEFQRMLSDALEGKIDMIITKSISRFARNTTLLLSTIRELKKHDVDVFFEEQNIHTLSNAGELLLTITASVAEEELISMSNNMRWRISKTFEVGKVWGIHSFYGYDVVDGIYVINKEQAEVIRRIYKTYLEEGIGCRKIATILNQEKVPSPVNKKWCQSSVRWILTNITYTGNLLLGKFSNDINPPKKNQINDGKYPRYYVEESHEPIVCLNDFKKVQDILNNRKEKFQVVRDNSSIFTGFVKCANCGINYLRKVNEYRTYWICGKSSREGKKVCPATSINESTLYELTSKVLKKDDLSRSLLEKNLKEILVHQDKKVEFVFKDGSSTFEKWEFKSRKLSWTDEMKEEARKREVLRIYGKNY